MQWAIKINKIILNYKILLFLIFLTGIFLRFYRLSEIPVGLHIDEAQVGYNAYSLLKTGKDETGKFLSTHLTLWKVDRPLGISYLSIPGIILFGLNEFGTRAGTAFIGSLSVILVFLLSQIVFNNKKIALLTSFLFAISPWHINLSRATSEAVPALFFYMLALISAILAIRKNNLFCVVFMYFSFLAGFFMYHNSRLTAPFWIIFFMILTIKNKRKIFWGYLISLIIYLFFPLFLFSSTSVDRFKLVSVFNNPETKLLLEEQIRDDGLRTNPIITRMVHNKLVNYSLKITENISSYFTFDYLLFFGGQPLRYHIPNMGLLYLVEYPFFLWGLFIFLKDKITQNKFILCLIIIWVILGILPAIFTVEESPNINRSLFILPFYQWFTALGLLNLGIKKNKAYLEKGIYLLILIIFSGNIFYFFHQYSIHTFTRRPWYRFYEMKELVNVTNKYARNYKEIIITFNSTEPYIFYLFYNQTDPKIWQSRIKEKGLNFAWNKMDKITIERRDCPDVPLEKRSGKMIVYKQTCKIPKNSRILSVIKTPDQEPNLIAVDFPEKPTSEETENEEKNPELNYYNPNK